jgi:hypothetical protein
MAVTGSGVAVGLEEGVAVEVVVAGDTGVAEGTSVGVSIWGGGVGVASGSLLSPEQATRNKIAGKISSFRIVLYMMCRLDPHRYYIGC